MAWIYFPDGTIKFADYSTVVEELLLPLYSKMATENDLDSAGKIYGRNTRFGAPDPVFRDVPQAPLNELIPLKIIVEPDNASWTALFCPKRHELLGPYSRRNISRLQEGFSLKSDANGMWHLCENVDYQEMKIADAVCGIPQLYTIIPFYKVPSYPNMPISDIQAPVEHDLYAEWNSGQVCRECLTRKSVIQRDYCLELLEKKQNTFYDLPGHLHAFTQQGDEGRIEFSFEPEDGRGKFPIWLKNGDVLTILGEGETILWKGAINFVPARRRFWLFRKPHKTKQYASQMQAKVDYDVWMDWFVEYPPLRARLTRNG